MRWKPGQTGASCAVIPAGIREGRLSITLPAAIWRAREAAHRARVAPLAETFLRRRSNGVKHPVWDFLFTYYSFSPSKLMTWCPALSDATGGRSVMDDGGGRMSWEWPAISQRVANEARWIAQLCANVSGRPARFACHGLHEWAMVYRLSAEQVRHNGVELRMTPGQLAKFVESQSLCCTHYDAFRFFTPGARSMNSFRPEFDLRLDMEQGGCIHANMDLYKWSYKLWPWIGSDLVADAFELAAAGRVLDMRSSPYDLGPLGFDPLKIETEEGREAYRGEQRRISELAEPVRVRLHEAALKLAELADVS
jgi:hypothetical protein